MDNNKSNFKRPRRLRLRSEKGTGCVTKHKGWWVLRYRELAEKNGQKYVKLCTKRLAPISEEFDRETAVRANPQCAAGIHETLKAALKATGESVGIVVSLGDFVESVFLPNIRKHQRPSTAKAYADIWESHLKDRCSRLLPRRVRCCDIQRLLDEIAANARNSDDLPLSRNTLKHIKSVLSGMFKEAKRLGFFDGENPVRDTKIPSEARHGEDTYAYSLEEALQMIALLPEPASTVVAVAAFTGLRRGEICGLRWEDYAGGELRVCRSIWKGHVTGPKTKRSAAPIPVIKQLAERLEQHRLRCGNPESGPMFASGTGGPADLNNLLGRVILPTLNRCAHCDKAEVEHAKAQHPYERKPTLPKWHGYHAFRRGLATNLNRLGVGDKKIQSILRHEKMETTMNIYVKPDSQDAADGMQTLERELERVTRNVNLDSSPDSSPETAPSERKSARVI